LALTASIVSSAFLPERITTMPPVTSPSPSSSRCRAQLRAELQMGNVGETHGYASRAHAHGNLAEIVQAAQITRGAHHVLGLRQLQHRAAGFLIGAANGSDDFAMRDAVGAQPIRSQHDLVLTHGAAERRDFGNVRHALQLVFQEPVLQGAQLRQVVAAAAIDDGVFVDPAHAGRVRTEGGLHVARQAALRLVQILQHARARPYRSVRSSNST
jgi:hypothetical protein